MLAARRHYIPANVPLVKHVAAAAGDEVCALGQEVFINGRLVAERRAVDAGDRPMPSWSGCVRLHGSQLFLLMTDNLASFDGRRSEERRVGKECGRTCRCRGAPV